MEQESIIKLLLLIHAFATWALFGIIWFVHVVYHPLYQRMGQSFSVHERHDLQQMGKLLAPIFFFEWISAILLDIYADSYAFHFFAKVNLILLGTVWVISLVIKLRHKNPKDLLFFTRMHRMLLSSHWIRTVAWSLRGVIVLCMCYYY